MGALPYAAETRPAQGCRLRTLLPRLPQVPEQGRGRRQDHLRVSAEDVLVGLEAAGEGVELGVLAVGLGVDARALGVPVAAGLLRRLVGLREEDRLLLVG